MESSPIAPSRSLTEYDARTLTESVKSSATQLWSDLLRLYVGGAHMLLGYASWSDYCAAEFEMTKDASYRILRSARVVAELEIANSPIPTHESQVRELTRVEPTQRAEVWQAAVEEHGPEPTAKEVRQVVQERYRSPARQTYSPTSFVPGPMAEPIEVAPVSEIKSWVQRLPEEKVDAIADMFLDAQLPTMVEEVVLTAAGMLLKVIRHATKELQRIDWDRVTDDMRASDTVVKHIGYVDRDWAEFEAALQRVRLPMSGLRRVK
jgi:hypothetical protein